MSCFKISQDMDQNDFLSLIDTKEFDHPSRSLLDIHLGFHWIASKALAPLQCPIFAAIFWRIQSLPWLSLEVMRFPICDMAFKNEIPSSLVLHEERSNALYSSNTITGGAA